MKTLIEHIFVLMLENRSFDHMLGFSAITGTDAENGSATKINGLSGTEVNTFNGQTYTVAVGADFVMPVDPHHEFTDILHQLCGLDTAYPPGGAYPKIDSSGFVGSYAASGGGANPGEIMRCFSANQLPVLNALAKEFVVCDNWYASLPGPTWPNRMFAHAGSSAGLDHSPTKAEIIAWETVDGFQFENGTIFDALNTQGIKRRIYAGDHFPMVSALKGIRLDDIRDYSLFAGDLRQPEYPYSYIFIEPSYNVLDEYRNSTSQHPLTDVTLGEALIKTTYEAIRNSTLWEKSLLIITWDEHGGFYDHVAPPLATAPGDDSLSSKRNQAGFTFDQYGPRVPALIISPLIPRNLIDHRVYDHSSICATIERLFGIVGLTNRDRTANGVNVLATLSAARPDTPIALPEPAGYARPAAESVAASTTATARTARPDDPVDDGNLPGIIHSAMRQHLDISPQEREAIIAKVQAIRTRAEAEQYFAEVKSKIAANRSGPAL